MDASVMTTYGMQRIGEGREKSMRLFENGKSRIVCDVNSVLISLIPLAWQRQSGASAATRACRECGAWEMIYGRNGSEPYHYSADADCSKFSILLRQTSTSE